MKRSIAAQRQGISFVPEMSLLVGYPIPVVSPEYIHVSDTQRIWYGVCVCVTMIINEHAGHEFERGHRSCKER